MFYLEFYSLLNSNHFRSSLFEIEFYSFSNTYFFSNYFSKLLSFKTFLLMETQGLQFIVKGVTPSQSNYVDFDPYIFVCKVRRRSFDVQVRPRILSILGFLLFSFIHLSITYLLEEQDGPMLIHLSITYDCQRSRMDLFSISLHGFHISHICLWMFIALWMSMDE